MKDGTELERFVRLYLLGGLITAALCAVVGSILLMTTDVNAGLVAGTAAAFVLLLVLGIAYWRLRRKQKAPSVPRS